jgi:hypothetical protein
MTKGDLTQSVGNQDEEMDLENTIGENRTNDPQFTKSPNYQLCLIQIATPEKQVKQQQRISSINHLLLGVFI